MASATLTAPLDVLKTRLQSTYYQQHLAAARAARGLPPIETMTFARSSLLHIRETGETHLVCYKDGCEYKKFVSKRTPRKTKAQKEAEAAAAAAAAGESGAADEAEAPKKPAAKKTAAKKTTAKKTTAKKTAARKTARARRRSFRTASPDAGMCGC